MQGCLDKNKKTYGFALDTADFVRHVSSVVKSNGLLYLGVFLSLRELSSEQLRQTQMRAASLLTFNFQLSTFNFQL